MTDDDVMSREELKLLLWGSARVPREQHDFYLYELKKLVWAAAFAADRSTVFYREPLSLRLFRAERAVRDLEKFWATEKQGEPPMAPVDMYSREASSVGVLERPGRPCFVCREPIPGPCVWEGDEVSGPLPKHEHCSDLHKLSKKLAAAGMPEEDPDPIRNLHELEDGMIDDGPLGGGPSEDGGTSQ